MSRPSIAPGLLADLTAAAPARLVKKLDATPTLAESYAWSPPESPEGSWTIVTDSGERVTLTPVGGALARLEQVGCSCLLSPKCLHLLAVATLLPVAAEAEPAQAASGEPTAPVEASAGPALVALSASQLAAAGLAQMAAARLLSEGADGAGTVLRGEWLRAAHAARAEGLPRLAAACTRVAGSLQALKLRSPSFRLGDLTADVALAVTVSHLLVSGPVDPSWLGVARRTYRNVGHLALTGLFSEPVMDEGGAKGVRTWLRDAGGRLYCVVDERPMPGEENAARAAYDRGADIGDVSASHRALGRAGLFLQDATVSDDGRLGKGKDVRAVLAQSTPWRLDAPDSVFARPLDAQLQALSRQDLDADPDGEGALLFFPATILGATGDALVLDAGRPEPVLARAGADAPGLTHRESLRALAAAAGTTLLCAARLRWTSLPEVDLLAVGGSPGLPESWAGRCVLGLDRLQTGHLEAAGRTPQVVSASETFSDPFEGLRARLGRLVLGGRGVLTPTAVQHSLAAADALQGRLAPGAAHALRALSAGPAADRPRAFAAAHRHLRAADRALTLTAWGA